MEKTAIELIGDPSLQEWFERAVHSTEDLRLDDALATVGIKAVVAPATSAEDKGGAEDNRGGCARRREPVARMAGRDVSRKRAGRWRSRRWWRGRRRRRAAWRPATRFVAADGFRGDLKQRLSRAQPGQTVRLSVFRMDELLELTVQLAAAPRDTVTFIPAKDASAEQLAAREKWLGRALAGGVIAHGAPGG